MELLQRLHLLTPKGERPTKEEFSYLRGGCDNIDPKLIDDVVLYKELVTRMDQELAFSADERLTIWRIVGAVLHIGNMELSVSGYDEMKNQPCGVRNEAALKNAAELLGCRPESLQYEITYRGAVGDAKRVACKPSEAHAQRDSLAKSIYHGLFMWLVGKMNAKLIDDPGLLAGGGNKENVKTVGLLDIYGFECFEANDYEQMLINYTNEKLQKLYLNAVFETEKVVFKEEGVGHLIANLQYTDRTTAVIELLDNRAYGKPQGILNKIDDYKKNEDMVNFMAVTTREFGIHPNFGRRKERGRFVIKHTARDVVYDAKEFIEKNLDKISDDLREFMLKKCDPAISGILKARFRQIVTHSRRTAASRGTRSGRSFRLRSVISWKSSGNVNLTSIRPSPVPCTSSGA